MRITGVRTQPYRIPLNRLMGDVNNPVGSDTMVCTAVMLDTDEGLTGIAVGQGSSRSVHNMTSDVLVGRDPRGVVGLWHAMVSSVFKVGNRGDVTAAIAALDVALWDLKAQTGGEPLWKTLGASSRRVRAYASGIDLPLSDDQLRTYYEGMAAKGICAGKLKIGLNLDADMRRIGIMRDALANSGNKPELMIDVNEYWSPKQTIRYMHEVEQEFDITWIEEPARRWDVRGLKKVSDSIRAAVASGENLDDVCDFVPLIAGGAIDIVNLGHKSSGITGMMQVAHLAHAFDLPVALMGAPGSYTAHFAAVLPNHIGMELLAGGRGAFFNESHEVEDGWIVLSDRPGIGLSFNDEKLRQHAVEDGPGCFTWPRRRGAGLYVAGPDEEGAPDLE